MLPQNHDAAPDGLRDARRISLAREPTSPEAHAFTAAVLAMALPHSGRTRAVGAGTVARMHREVGTILAGLLRSDVVAAQRGGAGGMWKPGGHLVSRRPFWGHMEALETAGLAMHRLGTQERTADGYTGRPTKLWRTLALDAMARTFGVDGTRAHWWFNPAVLRHLESQRPDVRDCIGWKDIGGVPSAIPEAHREAVEPIRARVAALNAHLAAARIEGCRAPVLVRRFRHGLQLGGRLYAKGTDSVTTIRAPERLDIRVNGEPVAEVDISASHLTIFLALAGSPQPQGDPYALAGLPRAAVKFWTTTSLGAGKPMRRWADNPPAETVGLNAALVGAAVLAVYPALRDMPAILPAGLVASVPGERRGWAVGQFIAWHESEAIMEAMERLQAGGVVALPVHDSLVVPLSAAGRAEEALRGAYHARFTFSPRLNVHTGLSSPFR